MESLSDPAMDVLLDVSLMPDPLEADQLSGATQVPDFWCRGARITLTRTGVTVLSEPTEQVELRLRSIFHPPPQARFRSASVQLLLVRPELARIHSIEPVKVSGESIKRETGAEVKVQAKFAAGSVAGSRQEKAAWTEVPVLVRGSLNGPPSLAY